MTATSPTTPEYKTSPNKVLSAANRIDYAYREVGEGTPPLVLLQHYRGNLDNWDPALIDALASTRHVVTFDNVGVGVQRARRRAPSRRWPGRPRVPRSDGVRARRRPRILDRQLRRAGDRTDPAGLGPSSGARLVGPPGRSRHARLGPRSHRCRRRAQPPIPRDTSTSSTRARRRARKPAGRPGPPERPDRRPRQANDLADTAGPIRRSLRVGDPGARAAGAPLSLEMPVLVANGDSDPMILPR